MSSYCSNMISRPCTPKNYLPQVNIVQSVSRFTGGTTVNVAPILSSLQHKPVKFLAVEIENIIIGGNDNFVLFNIDTSGFIINEVISVQLTSHTPSPNINTYIYPYGWNQTGNIVTLWIDPVNVTGSAAVLIIYY